MKKYIEPTTQVTHVALHSVICMSVTEGDPTNALAPNRSFNGDSYSNLKYLI